VSERDGFTVLIVSGDPGRSRRAAAALSSAGNLVQAAGMSAALEEVSLRRPDVTVLDGELPGDAVARLLGAVGDAERVVLWIREPWPELAEQGVLVQIPYAASDRVLLEAVRRAVDLQRLRLEAARGSAQAEQFRRVVEVVRRVRHDINSPLTAIMAETELLLMDADRLTSEQLRGLDTIEAMARRIRDLVADLRDLQAED
jgi:signal transduction histidine kinase